MGGLARFVPQAAEHADEAARLIARLGDNAPSPQVIRAYHGSPYDFDRFDASKIGTGEGAQAYGHGLYFAENEGVARQYRDSLKDILDTDPTERQALDLQDAWNDWMAKQQLAREWEKPKGGLSNLLAELGEPNPHLAAERAAAARWMQLNSEIERATKNPGRVYEVEIGYPAEALLNWDKPMGEAMAARLTPKLRGGLERGIQDRLDMGQLERHADNLQAMRGNPALAPGQVLHEGLSADVGSASAARGLLGAGIPGIRYLDQGSRAAGAGTRNYVIFPGAEDQIRILRKYAVP